MSVFVKTSYNKINILEEFNIFQKSLKVGRINTLRLNFLFLRRKLGNKRVTFFMKNFGCNLSKTYHPSKNKNIRLFFLQKQIYFLFFLYRVTFLQKYRKFNSRRNQIAVQMLLQTYKGLRYQIGLPVHGQRTRSNRKNARFCKAPKYFLDTKVFNAYSDLKVKRFTKRWRTGSSDLETNILLKTF